MFPRKIVFKQRNRKNKAKHNFNPKLSLYWQMQYDEMFAKWGDDDD